MKTRIDDGRSFGFDKMTLAALAAAAMVVAAGCASVPPPTDQVAVATAAVAHADMAGAPALAPAEMRVAQDKLVRVNVAMAAKDHRQALWLAQETQLDAELAELKAQSAKAAGAAEAVTQDDRALRDELTRKRQQP
jgi:hypothetical protein